MHGLLWPAVTVLGTVLVDQLTKQWAVLALTPNESVEVIGRLVMLTLVFNEGGAMGTSFGSSNYYLVTSILVLAFVLYYIYANTRRLAITLPLSFIAGGAIGNILDRIRLGQVIDFIDIDFFDIDLFGFHLQRWWTFNAADVAISCSIAFLLFQLVIDRQGRSTSTKDSSPS